MASDRADNVPVTPSAKTQAVVRLTPSEWHAMLEGRSFLEREDNQLRPRRFGGAPVQIVPDDSYR